MNNFLKQFKSLYAHYEKISADDLYCEFIYKFGPKWSNDLLKYIPAKKIMDNRRGFYDFYFNPKYSFSIRSDPRSGMFVRAPSSQGGKIEILIHLSLGIEGLAELMNIERIINGINKEIHLDKAKLPIDIVGFEDSREIIDKLMQQPEALWDDTLILPNYEDALIKAKDMMLSAETEDSFDENAVKRLLHVALCGAHCPRNKPGSIVAEKMSEIHILGGAIRAMAKELGNSIFANTSNYP